MSAFALSTLLIFVAELGDKSQLVALSFATRYRWWVVLAGVTLATLLVHLGSVGAGRALDGVLDDRVLRVLVGASFVGFAWWSLRGDTIDEDDTRERPTRYLGALGIVAVAFFISELGDKTQLATVSLAGSNPDWVGVWLGSTAGMVLADALAVAVGLALRRQLPQRRIGQVAAALFVIFGLLTIASAFV
ncbi:MAG: TMEM165/GDT1 family protein [Dehalococcoidia bacterium]|nr:TMEM165/GDT1 family protein [Dehalococcoidia bacterium]